MKALRALAVIVLTAGLAACGGDGEDGTDTEVTTETTTGGEKTDDLRLQIAGREVGFVDVPDDQPQGNPGHHDDAHGHGIHMPNPSFYPLIAALGVGVTFSGLVVSPVVSICGVLILFYGIYSWSLEPAG